MLKVDQVLGRAVDVSVIVGPGVYILIHREVVVYVGQSRNPPARLGEHSKWVKYDRVLFIPCKPEDLIQTERDLINELKPTLNKSLKRIAIYQTDKTKAFGPKQKARFRDPAVEYVDPPTRFSITVTGIKLDLRRRTHG